MPRSFYLIAFPFPSADLTNNWHWGIFVRTDINHVTIGKIIHVVGTSSTGYAVQFKRNYDLTRTGRIWRLWSIGQIDDEYVEDWIISDGDSPNPSVGSTSAEDVQAQVAELESNASGNGPNGAEDENNESATQVDDNADASAGNDDAAENAAEDGAEAGPDDAEKEHNEHNDSATQANGDANGSIGDQAPAAPATQPTTVMASGVGHYHTYTIDADPRDKLEREALKIPPPGITAGQDEPRIPRNSRDWVSHYVGWMVLRDIFPESALEVLHRARTTEDEENLS